MKKLIAVALVSVLGLSACGSSGGAVTNLDAKSFSQKITEAGVTVLDVRSAGEFSEGHLQGAINVDVEGMQFDGDIAKLDKTKVYAVYCHSGRRSVIASKKMADAGFTSIFNLTGGILEWTSAGFPVVTV